MGIYIEPLIVQNLLLDYAIGASAYRFLRLKQEKWRLWLAAMAGSAAALLFPFFRISGAVSIVLKLSIGILMSLILFFGKYNFIKGAVAFFAATFMFGGSVFMIGYLKYGNVADALGKPLSPSVWVIAIGGALPYCAVKLFGSAFHRQRDMSENVYRYHASICGYEIDGAGFLDTGNRLYDTVTGLPVVIIGVKTLMPYMNDEAVEMLLTGHADKVFSGARRFACGSVGGRAELWLVVPEKFEVYLNGDKNILYDVAVGLSFSSLGGGKNYDAILHPSLSEVI